MIHSFCKAIIAGHVSAIGMANINLNMSYTTCLQVHTNLAGIPKKISGCGSNELGEFTTVVVDLYSLENFVEIDAVADLLSEMAGPTNVPDDLLKDINFAGTTVSGALMSN